MKISLKIIVIIVCILVVAGLMYLFIVRPILDRNNALYTVTPASDTKETSTVSTTRDVQSVPVWYTTDKDGDGISDEEEKKLGTNEWEPDTDSDGISDRTEIEKLGTDPTNPDTDGDGYWDGEELINGYNPLGDGKLE